MVWCTAQQGPQQDLSWYLLGYNWGKKRNDRRYLTISFKSRRHWKQSFLSIFKIVESATLCIWDENNFKPHLQIRILVALRGSFSNCRQAPHPFYIRVTPSSLGKAWSSHFHFLCFIMVAKCSCSVLAHSHSFVVTFSQKIPSIWQNLFVVIITVV